MAGYREFRAAERRKRRLRRARAAALVLLAAVLLAGGVFAAVKFWKGGQPSDAPSGAGPSASAPNPGGGQASAASGSQTAGAQEGAPNSSALSRWEEMALAGQTINGFSPLSPNRRLYALPQNGRVDVSYFDDAVFVGDSISTGWSVYREASGMLPNPNVVAEKGASPPANGSQWARNQNAGDLYDPLEAIVALSPKKIYVMLGANMLVAEGEGVEDRLVSSYGVFIDDLRARLPGVKIYVQSILLPTAEYSAAHAGLTPERINRVNDRLAALSFEKNCYYLDLEEYLCKDGVLNWDIAQPDGLHINTDGYRGWLEYLVTHTAYDPANPYTETPQHY